MNRKALLMILDGWGIGSNDPKKSAVAAANTPFVDSLYKDYPNSTLQASGMAVGLPDGQMGNSEVGHMNIGAGRVVYQDLVKVNKAIDDGSLEQSGLLQEAFAYAKSHDKKVHFMGLLSDGGVHSHIYHLEGLISAAHHQNLDQVYVHAFTDGRDTDPYGGAGYMDRLEKHLKKTTGKVASVSGRYYAMDRDKRWERVKLAYDTLVNGEGETADSASQAIQKSYDQKITDEFIKPTTIQENGQPIATIDDGDVVICFNFRTDRARQITEALTQKDFPDYDMHTLNLHYITLTRYDETFKDVKVLFEKDNLKNTLGEVISKAGKSQIRIAETEKYPHVTFFFSGGREEQFEGESRIMVPSPKVATYDLQPEMSAREVTDKIVPELKSGNPDFVCLNYANPDMVGHTGDFDAAVKACETVDAYAKEVTEAALSQDYAIIIIADHGNCEVMVNEDGSPNTAHTTNLAPCFLVTNDGKKYDLKDGKLGDLGPTFCKIMGIEQPEDMTGESMI